MSRTALMGLAVLLLSGGVLVLGPRLAERLKARPAVEAKLLGTEVDDEFEMSSEWLTEYTLTERSGSKFHSENLAGKVHVVNFFFTACPTACPLQTQKVQELDREFGTQGVHFVSISCDPDTDTPPVLQQFANRYNADKDRWVFLTGNFAYIRRVAAEVYWAPLSKRGHREDLTVVDKWGKVRGNFPWNDPQQMQQLKELLTTLLAETEPPPEPEPAAGGTPENVSESDSSLASETDAATESAPADAATSE